MEKKLFFPLFLCFCFIFAIDQYRACVCSACSRVQSGFSWSFWLFSCNFHSIFSSLNSIVRGEFALEFKQLYSFVQFTHLGFGQRLTITVFNLIPKIISNMAICEPVIQMTTEQLISSHLSNGFVVTRKTSKQQWQTLRSSDTTKQCNWMHNWAVIMRPLSNQLHDSLAQSISRSVWVCLFIFGIKSAVCVYHKGVNHVLWRLKKTNRELKPSHRHFYLVCRSWFVAFWLSKLRLFVGVQSASERRCFPPICEQSEWETSNCIRLR